MKKAAKKSSQARTRKEISKIKKELKDITEAARIVAEDTELADAFGDAIGAVANCVLNQAERLIPRFVDIFIKCMAQANVIDKAMQDIAEPPKVEPPNHQAANV